MDYKATLYFDPCYNMNRLFVRGEMNGELYAVENLTFRKISRGEMTEPMLQEASKEFVQAIMNAGWEAGLKPAGLIDSTEALSATKYHLEDMRKLAGVHQTTQKDKDNE